MKIFKHALFIVGGFILIYLLSVVTSAYQHQTKLNNEVLEGVKANQDYDEWFAFQTHLFKHIETEITTSYKVDFYAVVEQKSVNEFTSNIYVLVMPIASVDYAETVRDTDDQSSIMISNSSGVLLNTKNEFKNQALSYGLHPSKIGFIYQGIAIHNQDDLTFEVFDYHGQLIIEHTLDEFIIDELIIHYDSNLYESYLNDYNYENGYTSQDISAILNPRIRQTIFLYVSVYFGAVLMGYALYFGFQFIKINKAKKDKTNA